MEYTTLVNLASFEFGTILGLSWILVKLYKRNRDLCDNIEYYVIEED